MSNIRKIKLAEVKVEGGKEVKENQQTISALLNNRALKYGISSGLIDTTNLMTLFDDVEENIETAWKLLYLSAYGADREIIKEYSLDEFIELLDVPITEVRYLAQTTILGTLPETYDEFMKELQSKTEKTSSEKK